MLKNLKIDDATHTALRLRSNNEFDTDSAVKQPDGTWEIGLSDKTLWRVKQQSRPGETPNDTIKRLVQSSPLNAALTIGGITIRGMPKEEVRQLLGRQDIDYPSQRELKIIEAIINVRNDVMTNPNYDEETKTRIFAGIREAVAHKRTMMSVWTNELAITHQELDAITKRIKALEELKEWLDKPLTLQKPDGSTFHKIREAWADLAIVTPLIERELDQDMRETMTEEHQIFVIEHDWAGAFATAQDFDGGEIALPFPICAFELQISGRRICVSIAPGDSGEMLVIPHIQTNVGWVFPWMYGYENGAFTIPRNAKAPTISAHNEPIMRLMQPLMDMIGAQIRAVSIALEAKVAEADVVRAPHRLNRAREQRGKLPICDYHVVSLARRSRPARLERDPDAAPGTKKRLHFRRGHWRHYDNHKTKIEWMLCGDPELGFIDKHYKL